MNWRWTIVGIMIGFCVGCSAGPEPLLNTTWQLMRYTLGSETVTAVPGAIVTINFGADTVSGESGCNNFMGNVQYGRSGRLRIQTLENGEVACPGSFLRQQEDALLSLLASTERFELTDDTLLISSANGTLMFRPMAETVETETAVPATLTTPVWELVAMENSSGVLPTVQGPTMTLLIAENEVSGFGGCNPYSVTPIFLVPAAFILQLDQLTHGVASCDFAIDMQERIYFELLQNAETFTLEDDTLIIFSANGTLTFRKQG